MTNSEISSINDSEKVLEEEKISETFTLIDDANRDLGLTLKSMKQDTNPMTSLIREVDNKIKFSTDSKVFTPGYNSNQ